MSTEILLDARRVKSQMTWKTFEGAIQVRSRQGFDEEPERESTSCEKFCLRLSEDAGPGERSRLGGRDQSNPVFPRFAVCVLALCGPSFS